ncbi:MAG: MFS transporter, partial [Burkholderiales bacterium]
MRLFFSRRFFPMCVTQFLGAFNDNLFKNAFILLLTFSALPTSDSGLFVAIASAMFVVPFFLFSAFAGQLADQMDKARLIRMVKIAELFIILMMGWGFIVNSIPALMLGIFLLGTHSAFFGPAKYAVLPHYLKPNELLAGNGIIEATTFLAILLGTLLSGLIMEVGTNHHYWLWGLLIACAMGGMISSIFLISAPAASASAPKLSWNIGMLTVNLLAETFRRRRLSRIILAISWFWLLGAAILMHLPHYVREVLHGEPIVLSLLLTLFSLGIGMGSLL